MAMRLERNVPSFRFPCPTLKTIAVAILTVAVAGVSAAAPPGAEKESAARPAPKPAPSHGADMAAQWLSILASTAAPNLEGLIKPEEMDMLSDNLWKAAGNIAKFVADNRGNETILQPLSENSAELFSGNKAKLDVDNNQKANLLSNNPESEIEVEPFSENDVDLLSHNHPRILSGNRAKLFSDVNVLSGITVSVTINIQRGDEHPDDDDQKGVESEFRRLDRNSDGRISAEEFRSAMRSK